MKIMFYLFLILLVVLPPSPILAPYSLEEEKSRVYGFYYNNSFSLLYIYGNVTLFQQKYQEFNKGDEVINSETTP